MRTIRLLAVACLCTVTNYASAEEVVSLTTKDFDKHLQDHKHTLVAFYAPWCGHCKKLAPEYEKAAVELKGKVSFAQVDATEEKELASKYSVKSYPMLVWFEESKHHDYDGGRNFETILEWVRSMTGPTVIEASATPPPFELKPNIALHADSLLPGFEAAAKANRRKAEWYFIKGSGPAKIALTHSGEDPIELTDGVGDEAKITSFLSDNELPLFGKLDGDSFEKYLAAGKGLVWSLLPMDDVNRQYRPFMSQVAKKVRGRYFVTYTDVDKWKEAIDSMLGVSEFPAIVVQKKAGDKKKFLHKGELNEQAIAQFIEDVDAGRVEPILKSEPVPADADQKEVRLVVGSTLKTEVFLPDKDVMLFIYAPWCGHCKKLDPEYTKLAKKVRKEEITDLITITKIDGTANDSPLDSIEWSGFPTIFFTKAGNNEPLTYDGERTAKGLWKYIKKTATKAEEIEERLRKGRGGNKKSQEL